MPTKPTTLKRVSAARRHMPRAAIASAEAPRFGSGRGGRPWRRLREQILERDGGLCQCDDCRRRPLPLVAHEVDHIDNTRGPDGELNDSPENLRAVNKDCHLRITKQQIAESNPIGTMTPAWLPVTQKPLIVVAGPPSAGKSTWVREAAKPGDLVVDLDALAPSVLGKPMWASDSRERSLVIRERNTLLAEYMRAKTSHERCFLVDTAGTFRRRKFWLDRGAEVVTLDTDKEICRARIRQCTERPQSTQAGRLAAVDRWE